MTDPLPPGRVARGVYDYSGILLDEALYGDVYLTGSREALDGYRKLMEFLERSAQ